MRKIFVVVLVIIGTVVLGINIGMIGMKVGRGLYVGTPITHNSIPVNQVMEIHAVSNLGLPDYTHVLASPFGSYEEPKYYRLGVDMPEGARCFTAYPEKDSLDHHVISFTTCPEPVAAETPPPTHPCCVDLLP